MGESAEKRHADTKSLTEKDSQKAGLEGDLIAGKDAKKNAEAELMALGEYSLVLSNERLLPDLHLFSNYPIPDPHSKIEKLQNK